MPYSQMRSTRISRLAVCGVIAWAFSGVTLVPTPARAATPQQIDAAIAKAKEYLYSEQKNGNWEGPARPDDTQVGGMTALATYALLAAGESAQGPHILDAVKYLERTNTEGMYAIGLRSHVWLHLGPPWANDVKAAFQKDASALLNAAHADRQLSQPTAFYRYTLRSNDWDHSVSQYAVLGMWACDEAGIAVPNGFWPAVDYGWRAHQYPDGSWTYSESGGGVDPAGAGVRAAPKAPVAGAGVRRTALRESSTLSMTAAGVATLALAQDHLHNFDNPGCIGNATDPGIQAGLDWIADHFAVKINGQRLLAFYLQSRFFRRRSRALW